ncbi:MAG: hypothetical protein ACRDTA_21790 [Pseudonocardiaceae bacterium]
MSTTGSSPTANKFKLSFYFWLPAGRDEFELDGGDDHHFENTANYRDGFEGAIAKYFEKILNEKLNKNLLEGFRFDANHKPRLQDSHLGFRELAFEFHYEFEHDENQAYNLPKQLRGRAVILSNGLYLWQFDVEYPSNSSDQEITGWAKKFLREHFVARHIAKLFDFEWTEELGLPLSRNNEQTPSKNDEKIPRRPPYGGVLTYYQIDLLFNGVFDKDAHPANFIKPSPDGNGADRGKANYKVQGIIKSVSRFAIINRHYPLFGDGISWDTACGNTLEQSISIEVDLSGTTPNTDAEQLLSRFSHTGMEQFLKVAISFGLIHYKAGLDHCRAQLTTDSLMLRILKTSGELRRPSLPSVLSSADLQAYTSIVAGKLPTFRFLHGLIEDLAKTSLPFETRKGNKLGEPDGAAWVYSKFTLHNTLLHYQLHVESIKNDIIEINRSLEAGRTDQVIAELTDTRKLTEIASESANKTIHERNRNQLDELMVRLTRFALLFSFVQVYAALGVWLMDSALSDKEFPASILGASPWQLLVALGQWPALAFIIVLVYKTWVSQPDDSDESSETHVFDYSFLHAKLVGEDGSAPMIRELADQMPSIEPDGKPLPCASQSSFRETPLSAVERTKYTLESRDSPEGNGSYVFYIETDRRITLQKMTTEEAITDEYLREVRLVIKKPAEAKYPVKVYAQHIIRKCIDHLKFGNNQEGLELLDDQLNRLQRGLT